MSEALKSFNLIKSKLLSHLDFEHEEDFEVAEAIKEVEHTLLCEALERKALETIKDKYVNIYKIGICDDVVEYNKLRNTGKVLTKAEFDLLKEL